MNDIKKGNVFVEEYEFDKPLKQKIDSIIFNCNKDCQNIHFHTFDHFCVYDIKLTKIGNNETFNLTISGKSMTLYELEEKPTVARQNDFIFNRTKN